MLSSMFVLLDGKYYCVSSIVLKRKQGLSDEKAENCVGEVVDLIPKQMESYAFQLQMKKLASETSKQFYICGDGDTTV